MKSRHRSREIALQILYQHDLISHSSGQPLPQGSQVVDGLKYHFDYFAVPQELREFIGELVAGTLNSVKTIDLLLEKYAANWKVARMSSVDRSLLRMALYEMLNYKDSPRTVVIDEAIELAKQFGTSETPAFINGILDNVKETSLENIPSAEENTESKTETK
jgi:N utilization substance protein B